MSTLCLQIEFLPSDNSVGGFLSKEREKFGGGSQVLPRVFLVWGLKIQNVDPCGFADLECDGSQAYGEKVPFNTEKGKNQATLEVIFYLFVLFMSGSNYFFGSFLFLT